MEPKELIEKWVEAFNNGDADSLANLYAPDAINHQVANEPIVGRDNIHKMFAQEFATADMVCLVENIFQDGD